MTRPRGQGGAAPTAAFACLVGLGLVASGCAGSTDAARSPATTSPHASAYTQPANPSLRLVAYTSCDQFLQQVRAEALREVGPYGLRGASGPTALVPGEVGPDAPVARGGLRRAVPVDLKAASPAVVPAGAATPTTMAPVAGTSAGAGYSTTNDQEAGVDEPDTVKTDGQLTVVLRQQPIGAQVVDVGSSPPALDGFVPLAQLGQADGLFLVGDDAVVIGGQPASPVFAGGGAPTAGKALLSGVNPGGPMVPAPTATAPATMGAATGAPARPAIGAAVSPVVPVSTVARTQAVVVSLADPESPTVTRTFSFPGQLQGARLIDGRIVLALTSPPLLTWAYPANGTPAAQEASMAANRALVRSSTAIDWLPVPTVEIAGAGTTRTVSGAPSCVRTYHLPVVAGLGTVSIASFDATTSSPGNEVTVLGNADDVYASATQIYVAATDWGAGVGRCPGPVGTPGACCPVGPGTACPMTPAPSPVPSGGAPIIIAGFGATSIYGFDISNPAGPTYLGGGQVPGTLIGQYAMSEYDGYLRVATTVGEPTPAPVDGAAAPDQLADNMVTVLRPLKGALVTVGTLRDLGRGEKIDAVLFQGVRGYVVTSDQLDPLDVLDLSDPQRPALAGRVSLTGFPSLLQPLGNGLLVGIGQSLGQDLQAEDLQLEVFDVSDPARPSLVSRQALGDGATSTAETDPHAVLWWPQDNLLVLPVEDYAGAQLSSAADVWSVGPQGSLTRLGALVQPQTSNGQHGDADIQRAVVVGGDVYTVSAEGVMESDLTSLARVAWLPFSGLTP